MILPANNYFSNIVLIGMAGAGKSTVGPLLADRLDFSFIDTDELIAASRKSSLQDILNDLGPVRFQALEQKILCSLDLRDHVIATGGSAVYTRAGMEHLATLGPVVWLDVPLAELEQRVTNLGSRGLVNPGETDFAQLFAQRLPLYRQYSDLRLDCEARTPEQIVDDLARQLAENTVKR